MKRRAFIAGLGSTAAWPVVARGQQAGKVYRVTFISPATPVSGMPKSRSSTPAVVVDFPASFSPSSI
jgi:hypothetical protein